MVGDWPDGPSDPTQLRGRTAPWGAAAAFAILLLVVVAVCLRLPGLGVEGFADDEVHKWLAANRYLIGSFGGDDVEHPMLMKSLVALAIAAFGDRFSPEVLTRLPNVFAGALTVWATALLGRRLFGRTAALIGAGLLAVSTTVVGYHRVAKEDVLLGLFVTLSFWCLAEAKAAADDGRARDVARWELWSGAALGAAFASKYFLFYCLTPVMAYLWLRPVSAWRVPLRRWLALIGVSLAVFVVLNWAPFVPGTIDYLIRCVRGEQVGGDRGVSESIFFMGRLFGNLGFKGDATPLWFFGAFGTFKFLPATALLGLAGLGIALARRAPAHRVVLSWLFIFHLFFLVAGSKYGRFFVSIAPAFLLLAGHATVLLCRAASRWIAPGGVEPRPVRLATMAAAALLLLPEARATVVHAPHNRLYVNVLGGGDRGVDWFLPHCDYFDAGVREALAWIGTHAERGAEVCTEVDWTVRLYAERDGRPDLVSRPILPGRCCTSDRPCYVVVQPGRLYRHNQAAVEHLSLRRPDHVERIRGRDAARVYRLAPRESPFPGAGPTTNVSAR